MEHLTSKPPSSAREYYINLFCSKYKLKPSKGSHGVRKALKSWWSLSTAERQPFVDKFNLMQEKFKENYVNYLKSVKPFMKKKIIGEGKGNCVSENEIGQEANSQDINGSIHNEDSDQNNQDHAASAVDDPYPNDPASSHEILNVTEKVSKLPEPTLPCAKNGKELFEMVNNTTGENNLEWKDLSQVEKYKYRSAVFAIKKEYIKEYQNYLENLPPVDLFQHYIKSLESYQTVLFPLTKLTIQVSLQSIGIQKSHADAGKKHITFLSLSLTIIMSTKGEHIWK